jgi:hypothetical protein
LTLHPHFHCLVRGATSEDARTWHPSPQNFLDTVWRWVRKVISWASGEEAILRAVVVGELGAGYAFVSNKQMNNIGVIDPKQDYHVVNWIETSHRPRDKAFRDHRKQLLVAREMTTV